MPNPENLTSTQAADRLASALGDKPSYWLTRIRNELKRPNKVDRIPAQKQGGRWSFPALVLEDWISAISADRHKRGQLPTTRAGEVLAAFGVGQEGGSTTGRKFSATINTQHDEQTGEVFAQLITSNPMMIYRLSADELLALADEAREVGNFLKRADVALGGK